MKKIVITIVSALLLGAGAMHAEIVEGLSFTNIIEYEDFNEVSTLLYTINTTTHTATVTGPDEKYELDEVTVPQFVVFDEYPGQYVVTSIAEHAFYDNHDLTSIEIADGVQSIGAGAFKGCINLRYVILPAMLTEIADETFYKCARIYYINIPSNVQSIGRMAFAGAFQKASAGDIEALSQSYIYLEGNTPPTLGQSVFQGVYQERMHIYTPCDADVLASYKEAWSSLADRISFEAISKQGRLVIVQLDHGTVNVPESKCDLPLVATPDEGYKFVRWNNGVTDNPYDINVWKDTVIAAFFEPIMYKWEYESSDLSKGTISTDFTLPEYQYGTEITVTAEPKAGCKFVKWNNGSTDKTLTFTITEDTYVRAIFAEENAEVKTVEVSSSVAKILLKLPFIEVVNVYTLRIYYDFWRTHLLCTVHFDKDGKQLTIEYASAPRRMPAAYEQEAFTFELTGLDPDTEYFYVLEGHDEQGRLMDTYEGSAKTLDQTTGIDELTERPAAQKTLLNGRLIITLPDGKQFDATGVQM